MIFKMSRAPKMNNRPNPVTGAAKLCRPCARISGARMLLVLALIVLSSLVLAAAQQGNTAPVEQAPPVSQPVAPPAVPIQAPSEPAIADAVVISPHEVVLNGKSVGITTILIWHGESVSRFDLTVQPDLSEIQ